MTEVFHERIEGKKSAGVDGRSSEQFAATLADDIAGTSKKIIAGRFAFAPYAEIQVSKGRGNPPRILSLPTIRDQVVLSALKDYLHEGFSEAVNRRLPNAYVYEIKTKLHELQSGGDDLGFLKTDIAGFYDTIDREKLMNAVRTQVTDARALKLIHGAICNPTVPRNCPKSRKIDYLSPVGIPQGLAISNILADIYMQRFDLSMVQRADYYARYVDDILFLCSQGREQTYKDVRRWMTRLGLELNPAKTELGTVCKRGFDYLGYSFAVRGQVSVRAPSVQRLVCSMAATLTRADNHRDEFLARHSDLDRDAYAQVLVEDLNERITGAVSEKRRYGWLFYFSQINDMPLLFRLDRIVEKLCSRCVTLQMRRPDTVKSFLTAFRAMHRHRTAGVPLAYARNYDVFSLDQKREFLANRALLPEKRTKVDIEAAFNRVRDRHLKRLEQDQKRQS